MRKEGDEIEEGQGHECVCAFKIQLNYHPDCLKNNVVESYVAEQGTVTQGTDDNS